MTYLNTINNALLFSFLSQGRLLRLNCNKMSNVFILLMHVITETPIYSRNNHLSFHRQFVKQLKAILMYLYQLYPSRL